MAFGSKVNQAERQAIAQNAEPGIIAKSSTTQNPVMVLPNGTNISIGSGTSCVTNSGNLDDASSVITTGCNATCKWSQLKFGTSCVWSLVLDVEVTGGVAGSEAKEVISDLKLASVEGEAPLLGELFGGFSLPMATQATVTVGESTTGKQALIVLDRGTGDAVNATVYNLSDTAQTQFHGQVTFTSVAEA